MAITITPFHGVNTGGTATLTVGLTGLTTGDIILSGTVYRNSQGISTITALGQTMTQHGSTLDGDFLSLQVQKYTVQGGDPSSGNFVSTLTGAARQGSGIAVLRGADTLGTLTAATPVVGGTSISQNVSSQATSVVIAWGFLSGNPVVTLGGGQTVIQNEDQGSETLFSSYEAGAATVTMSNSWTGNEDAWQAAMNITALAGGGIVEDQGYVPGRTAQPDNPITVFARRMRRVMCGRRWADRGGLLIPEGLALA